MSILEQIIKSYKEKSIDVSHLEFLIHNLKEASSINSKDGEITIDPIGTIKFPYYELGSVKSPDLINFYEMIMFSFYWNMKNKYKKIADIGSNIGLHSIILKKCGYEVEAYEPDVSTSKILKSNLEKNQIFDVKINNIAVSGFDGEAEFIKINNNITGNHITGSKSKVYGDTNTYKVEVISLSKLCDQFDLIKLDIEGAEDQAICNLKKDNLMGTDIIVEIHDFQKSKKIFDHLNSQKIKCFAQKNNWLEVTTIDQMPKDYTEGALFISLNQMSW
jgi:FkbM family methyltransferase